MLYAVDTGLPTQSFEGPLDAVLSLAFSPDGGTLVGALSKHSMRVWNARDGHLIHKVFGGHLGPVAAVAFSPDGRTIASASYDHTVKLWRLEDPASRLRSSMGTPTRSAPSPSAPTAGGLPRQASTERSGSGTWHPGPKSRIRGHTGAVMSLAYLPDSARIATGSADETVRVWDTASGQELRTFKGHAADVVAVAVSPDGRDIASARRRDGAGLGRRQPAPPAHAREPLGADLRRGRGMRGVLPATADGWSRATTTTGCGSGNFPRDEPLPVIKGHTGRIIAPHSAPTAAPSPPAALTARCGCGTPPPG